MTDETPVTPVQGDAASIPSEDVKTDVQDSTQAEESTETQSEADKIRAEMQKRIDRLTAARHAEAKKREEAEQELGKYKAPKPDVQKPPERPIADKFDSQEAYEEALSKWADDTAEFKAQQKLAEREAKEKAEKAQSERAKSVEKRLKALDTKGAEFAKTNPDYDEKVSIVNEMVELSSMNPEQRFAMLDTFLDCENGPQIMHHLGQNPDELEAMFSMQPHQIIRTLTKLDLSQTSTPEIEEQEEKPVPKVVAPPSPIRGSGKPVKPVLQMTPDELLRSIKGR